MIPKRAFFYWEGPPMSRLRWEGLDSFRRHNPNWEVRLLDGEDVPLAGEGLLPTVHRSDWARYRALYRQGGVYFDTDMIFLKPIPDAWLAGELLLPERLSHIALLGAAAGAPLFAEACDECARAVESGQSLAYQALGINLLTRLGDHLNGAIVYVPTEAVLPIGWKHISELWNEPRERLPTETVAVHWFGGDHLSRHMEESFDFEGKSLLAGCIRASRGAA